MVNLVIEVALRIADSENYKKYRRIKDAVKRRNPEWMSSQVQNQASMIWKRVKENNQQYDLELANIEVKIVQ